MQQSIVCGQCGTSNPPSNKFCGNCGALLAVNPAPPSEALPDWLRFDAEPAQAATAGQPKAAEEEHGSARSEQGDDLPDWLREHVEATETTVDWANSTADDHLPAGLTLD